MSYEIETGAHSDDGVPLAGLSHPKACVCAGVQCSAFCYSVPHSRGRFCDEIVFKTKEWSKYQFHLKSGPKVGPWPEFRDALLAKAAAATKAPVKLSGHQALALGALSGRDARAFTVVKP